jgi:hypothetical protein
MDEFLKTLVRNGLQSPARVKWLLLSAVTPHAKGQKRLFPLRDEPESHEIFSGKHILSNGGAFIVNHIHEESKQEEANDDLLPYLCLDRQGWIRMQQKVSFYLAPAAIDTILPRSARRKDCPRA